VTSLIYSRNIRERKVKGRELARQDPWPSRRCVCQGDGGVIPGDPG